MTVTRSEQCRYAEVARSDLLIALTLVETGPSARNLSRTSSSCTESPPNRPLATSRRLASAPPVWAPLREESSFGGGQPFNGVSLAGQRT